METLQAAINGNEWESIYIICLSVCEGGTELPV